jgi:ParB family chromosome partitioning protein
MDVDEWEAEYLLIAENVERRGEAETDPIKKARIAQFLKEYWGVRDGSAGKRSLEAQNGLQNKTLKDIAETLDESVTSTKRLIKLNDLIPELQQLVSDGKLGTTAGEQLAYLTEDAQRELWDNTKYGAKCCLRNSRCSSKILEQMAFTI